MTSLEIQLVLGASNPSVRKSIDACKVSWYTARPSALRTKMGFRGEKRKIGMCPFGMGFTKSVYDGDPK